MRKTPTKFRFGFAGRAHPHVCGENKGVAVLGKGMKGSSPRVRGKLIGCAGVRVDDGLIPACAGKTVNIPHCICEEPAHPRACGENFIPRPRAAPFGGSSPRMRGKRWVAFDSDGPHGLIPACAGKTHPRSIAGMDIRAHPRACGENGDDAARKIQELGSSPRMRGKQ